MNIAIILAAGSGKRMKAGIPKQFIDAGGKPVIIHTLEKFQACVGIDAIVTVCTKDHIGDCKKLVNDWRITKCISVIPGGAERYDSSRIGVNEAKKIASGKEAGTVVLIHDAARPFVTEDVINANIVAALKFGACETAIPVTDTVIRGKNGFSGEILPREDLFRVQTPQSFKLGVISEAFERYDPEADGPVTDDAALVLRLGGKVAIVEGSVSNIKITTPGDLGFLKQTPT